MSRPYLPGKGRWWVILWEAGAFVYLYWSTARLFHLAGPFSWALAAVLSVVWIAGAWRIQRIGLYVDDSGVMIRNLLSTRKISWQEIESIDVESVAYGIGSFSVSSGRCAFIRLAGGSRVNTSLWEKGVDFHRQPDVFRAVCRDLREQLSAATTAKGESSRDRASSKMWNIG